MRRMLIKGLKFVVLLIALLVMSNIWIVLQTKSEIHENIDDVPVSKLALVLGTSKYAVGGGINPFFQNRMEAAAELYKAGKVRHILVSGDNRTVYYNEPKTMKEELVKLGVPNNKITLDYAGLRTLDSIVRCKEVFGQQDITIVTQRFHSYRAIFLSQYYNLDVSGYVAGDVSFYYSPYILVREFFARPLAILDVFVLGTTPKHLGEKEELSI